jgi:hypothetical protein
LSPIPNSIRRQKRSDVFTLFIFDMFGDKYYVGKSIISDLNIEVVHILTEINLFYNKFISFVLLLCFWLIRKEFIRLQRYQ